MRKLLRFSWIAAVVLLADRLTKWAACRLTGIVTLIPGILGLRYAENTGMAFSLFSGKPWILGVVSLAVIIAGAFLLRRYQLGRLSCTAAMLILGGAVGNMLDRFFTGYVIDMVEFLFIRFPIFNVADSALVIGCVLLAWSLLRHPDEWKESHE